MIINNLFTSFEYREVLSALQDRQDKVNNLIETFEENTSFNSNYNLLNAYKYELKLVKDCIDKIRNTHYF